MNTRLSAVGCSLLAGILLSTAAVHPLTLCAAAPATQPATAPATNVARFPTFGVAFSPPAGWNRIANDKYKTIAQWTSADSGAGDPKSLITIEAGQVIGPSLEQVASKLAINFNGEVLEQPTTLDGERALRVRAIPEGDELAPAEGLVCMHGDALYLIMGGVAGGEAGGRVPGCRDEVESVRRTWKWIEFEPTVKNLAFREKPIEVFEGAATLNAPALMYLKPADLNAEGGENGDNAGALARRVHLSLYDLRKGVPQFSAFVELAEMPPGLSFVQVKEQFLKRMSARAELTPAPVWEARDADGRTPRVVTQCVEAGVAGAAPDARKHLQWALVSLGDSRLLLLNFTHTADTEEDRKVYEALAGRIVDSVTAGARKAQPATQPVR